MNKFLTTLLASIILVPSVQSAVCQSGPAQCQCEERQGSFNAWCTGLTEIPTNLPENTNILDIRDSDIERIPGNVFKPYKNLKQLRIENSKVKIIGSGAFNYLNKLETLILSNNPIENLHLDTTNIGLMGSLKTLKLNSCGQKVLTAAMFKNTPNVQIVDLGNNDIQTVPTNVFGTYIRELYLDGNPLTAIANGFAGLNNLIYLSLENCQIGAVSKEAFINTKLQTLNLRLNRLNADSIEDITFRPVQNYLTDLDFSQNALGKVQPKVYQGVGGLRRLNLSQTGLTSVPSSMFTDLVKLQDLDLSKNDFRTMSSNELSAILKTKAKVYLCGNPWHCDCGIKEMRDWSNGPDVRIDNPDMCLKCATPKDMKGRLMKGLEDKEIEQCVTENGALQAGTIAGIVVGGVLFIVIILIIIIVCCRKRRTSNEDKSKVISSRQESQGQDGLDGPQKPTSKSSSQAEDNNDGKKIEYIGDDAVFYQNEEEQKSVKRTPDTLKSASVYSVQQLPKEEPKLPKETTF